LTMNVPSIKTKKLREDTKELVDIAPTRGMYAIVLRSIDKAMDDLVAARDEVSSKKSDVKALLKNWDDAFQAFGEREAYYYKAFLESEDREIVDEPLFEGDYSGFDFKDAPKWPDIETPWRLANELSTIALASNEDEDYLEDLDRRFRHSIESFWGEANKLSLAEKDKFAAQASEEADAPEGNGRVYGFLPVLALGAVALVGVFGAAAGYATAKKGESGDYMGTNSGEEHLSKTKDMGFGFAVGVAVAALVMLRVVRNQRT
jgi:hypothetical protein